MGFENLEISKHDVNHSESITFKVLGGAYCLLAVAILYRSLSNMVLRKRSCLELPMLILWGFVVYATSHGVLFLMTGFSETLSTWARMAPHVLFLFLILLVMLQWVQFVEKLRRLYLVPPSPIDRCLLIASTVAVSVVLVTLIVSSMPFSDEHTTNVLILSNYAADLLCSVVTAGSIIAFTRRLRVSYCKDPRTNSPFVVPEDSQVRLVGRLGLAAEAPVEVSAVWGHSRRLLDDDSLTGLDMMQRQQTTMGSIPPQPPINGNEDCDDHRVESGSNDEATNNNDTVAKKEEEEASFPSLPIQQPSSPTTTTAFNEMVLPTMAAPLLDDTTTNNNNTSTTATRSSEGASISIAGAQEGVTCWDRLVGFFSTRARLWRQMVAMRMLAAYCVFRGLAGVATVISTIYLDHPQTVVPLLLGLYGLKLVGLLCSMGVLLGAPQEGGGNGGSEENTQDDAVSGGGATGGSSEAASRRRHAGLNADGTRTSIISIREEMASQTQYRQGSISLVSSPTSSRAPSLHPQQRDIAMGDSITATTSVRQVSAFPSNPNNINSSKSISRQESVVVGSVRSSTAMGSKRRDVSAGYRKH